MITRDPAEFVAAIEQGKLSIDAPAFARASFLVEPSGFHISEQTAQDNQYMDTAAAVSAQKALDQHRQLSEAISHAGLPTLRFTGRAKTPDDVFPNNVFATVPGRFIVGAMLHAERQQEAERDDIRNFFTQVLNYEKVELDRNDVVAELTGALVIDRGRRIGYCGMTQRVDDAGCRAMHEAFNLSTTFQFDLKPEEYHTNVVMAVLSSRALVICPDAFVDPQVPEAIAALYPDRVIRISQEQKTAFAGNIISLSDKDVFMSAVAAEAMGEDNLTKLRDWGFVVHAIELDEIEKAGGSLRCMVAEIF
jgi:hypothetical protein